MLYVQDPALVKEQHIHFGYPTAGAHVAWGKASCVRMLHVWSLFKFRSKQGLVPSDRRAVGHWFWQVNKFYAAGNSGL